MDHRNLQCQIMQHVQAHRDTIQRGLEAEVEEMRRLSENFEMYNRLDDLSEREGGCRDHLEEISFDCIKRVYVKTESILKDTLQMSNDMYLKGIIDNIMYNWKKGTKDFIDFTRLARQIMRLVDIIPIEQRQFPPINKLAIWLYDHTDELWAPESTREMLQHLQLIRYDFVRDVFFRDSLMLDVGPKRVWSRDALDTFHNRC
jgi:hypothetical protein